MKFSGIPLLVSTSLCLLGLQACSSTPSEMPLVYSSVGTHPAPSDIEEFRFREQVPIKPSQPWSIILKRVHIGENEDWGLFRGNGEIAVLLRVSGDVSDIDGKWVLAALEEDVNDDRALNFRNIVVWSGQGAPDNLVIELRIIELDQNEAALYDQISATVARAAGTIPKYGDLAALLVNAASVVNGLSSDPDEILSFRQGFDGGNQLYYGNYVLIPTETLQDNPYLYYRETGETHIGQPGLYIDRAKSTRQALPEGGDPNTVPPEWVEFGADSEGLLFSGESYAVIEVSRHAGKAFAVDPDSRNAMHTLISQAEKILAGGANSAQIEAWKGDKLESLLSGVLRAGLQKNLGALTNIDQIKSVVSTLASDPKQLGLKPSDATQLFAQIKGVLGEADVSWKDGGSAWNELKTFLDGKSSWKLQDGVFFGN